MDDGITKSDSFFDAPINTRASNFHLFKDNNGRFSPIISGLNMSFGAYVDGLSMPVNNSDLQQLDIFHDISNPLNYLNNKIYSNDRFKKCMLHTCVQF